MAGAAYGEEIFADDVVIAFLQIDVVLDKAENAAPHEYMGMTIVVCLDLFETFIQPIIAVSAIDHCGTNRPRGPDYCGSVLRAGVIPTSSVNSFFVRRAEKSASFFA
jgi:hypothetical protein